MKERVFYHAWTSIGIQIGRLGMKRISTTPSHCRGIVKTARTPNHWGIGVLERRIHTSVSAHHSRERGVTVLVALTNISSARIELGLISGGWSTEPVALGGLSKATLRRYTQKLLWWPILIDVHVVVGLIHLLEHLLLLSHNLFLHCSLCSRC